jgi:hypothetical protein
VRGQAAALRAADLEERAEKAPTEAERLFYFSLLLEHYEQTGQSERASALRTRLREGLE